MTDSDSDVAPFDPQIINLVLGLAVPGITLMILLLITFAYLAWHPTSRPHLNRVSFRLLVYTLIANIIYSATLIPSTGLLAPGPACTFVAFALNSSLMFSASLLFSMSLNLVLVLVYGVDGRMIEKYYLIGAFLVTAICNVTPLAAGQYGFFPDNDICWFTNPNPAIHVRWVIGTQSVWVLSMATLEIVSFVVIVSFMMRNQLRATRVLSNAASTSSLHTAPPPPVVLYRGLILRIGLYPLASCILNFSSSILALYLAENTKVTVLIGRLDLAVFSLRGLVYGLLAATDPSFLRALRSLRRGDGSSAFGSTAAQTTSTQSTMSRRTKRFSCGSKALVRVELERVADRPSVETRGASVETRVDEGTQEKPRAEAQTQEKPQTEARTASDPEQGQPTDAQGVQFLAVGQHYARRPSRSHNNEIACQI
ncbi:hypothetical protein FB451DRAFT_1369760 [Mycena latifolia]|nr:hypothetical protein FB451DRAFT_1369760 [Mycena latifolia]